MAAVHMVEAVGPLQQGLRLDPVNPVSINFTSVEAVGPLQQGLRQDCEYNLPVAGNLGRSSRSTTTGIATV